MPAVLPTQVDVDAARTEHHAGMVTVREAIQEAVAALSSGSKRDSVSAVAASGTAGGARKRTRVYADAVASNGSSSEDDSDDETAAPRVASTAPAAPESKAEPVAAEATTAAEDDGKGGSTAEADAGSGNSSDTAAVGQQTAVWTDGASAEGLDEILSLPKAVAESPANKAANAAAAERAAQEPVRALHQSVCPQTACCLLPLLLSEE